MFAARTLKICAVVSAAALCMVGCGAITIEKKDDAATPAASSTGATSTPTAAPAEGLLDKLKPQLKSSHGSDCGPVYMTQGFVDEVSGVLPEPDYREWTVLNSDYDPCAPASYALLMRWSTHPTGTSTQNSAQWALAAFDKGKVVAAERIRGGASARFDGSGEALIYEQGTCNNASQGADYEGKWVLRGGDIQVWGKDKLPNCNVKIDTEGSPLEAVDYGKDEAKIVSLASGFPFASEDGTVMCHAGSGNRQPYVTCMAVESSDRDARTASWVLGEDEVCGIYPGEEQGVAKIIWTDEKQFCGTFMEGQSLWIARGGNTAKPTDVRRLDKGAVVVVPGFDGFEAHVGKDFIEVSYEGETARITNDKVDFS